MTDDVNDNEATDDHFAGRSRTAPPRCPFTDKLLARRIDNVELVQVVKVSYIVGSGESGDPVRSAVAYYMMDGSGLVAAGEGRNGADQC